MADGRTVIAFDVDRESLASLRPAFPGWAVEVKNRVSTDSLDLDWDPGRADLLVVGAGDHDSATLGLYRALRSQVGRARTPLLVLVPPAREALVRAVLLAGATSCLVCPAHAKELVRSITRAREGGRPGRPTLDLSLPECRRFAEHLAGCNPCQVVIDNLRQTITLYRAGEHYALPPEFQVRLHQTLRERFQARFPHTAG
jgi:hypothetical protein